MAKEVEEEDFVECELYALGGRVDDCYTLIVEDESNKAGFKKCIDSVFERYNDTKRDWGCLQDDSCKCPVLKKTNE